MDLTSKKGTTTCSGLAPLLTPYTAVLGTVIAADVTVPTVTPPSFRVAATFTPGDVKAPVGFSSTNDNSYAVPFVKPTAATVSSSVPALVQAPVSTVLAPPSAFEVGSKPNAPALAVADPASPEMVTIDPAVAWCVVEVSVTVSVLVVEPETGVLCLIDLTLKTGSIASSG